MANPKIDYDKIAEGILGPITEGQVIKQIDDPDSFSSLVSRSLAGTKQAFFEGADAAATAIENKTGDTPVTDYLQEFGKSNSAKEQKKINQLGTPTLTTSAFDVESISDAAEFAKFGLASGLGSIGPSVAATGAASIVAGALFGTSLIGAALTTITLGLGPLAVIGIGEVYKSAKDKGATDEEAATGSIVAGISNGVIDRYLGGKILSKFINPVKADEVIKNLGKKSLSGQIAKDVVGIGAVAGATEAAQSAVTEVTSSKLAGQEIDAKEVGKQAINEGLIGTIFGGATGSVTGTLSKLDTDALIAQQKNADLYKEIETNIKKEDAENALSFERKEKEIKGLEDQLEELKIIKKEIRPLQKEINLLKRQNKKTFSQEIQNQIDEKENNLTLKKTKLGNPISYKREDGARVSGLYKNESNIQKQIKEEKNKFRIKKAQFKPFKDDLLILPPDETKIGTLFRTIEEKNIPFISPTIRGVNNLLGRATTRLRKEAIETYKKTGDTEPIRLYSAAETWNTSYMTRAGKYMSKFDIALNTLKPLFSSGLGNIVSGKDRKLLFNALITDENKIKTKLGNTKKADDIYEAQKPIRTLLKEVAKDVQDSGINMKLRDNYLPYKYQRIEGNIEKKFRNILTKKGFTTSQIDAIKSNINNEGGFYKTALKSPFAKKKPGSDRRENKNLEKTRMFTDDITNEFINEGIINTDVLEILPSYLMNAAKTIEFQNKFGNVREVLGKTNKEGIPIMSTEFQETIGNITDAIQGRYGSKINDSSFRKPYQFAMSAGYVATLPLAGFTALSEPFILFANGKFRSGLDAAVKLPINAFKRLARVFLPRLKKSDVDTAFDETMYGLDGALTERMNASSGLEAPTRYTNAFFKLTMLTQVTQLSRQMGFNAFRNQLRKDIKEVLNTDKGTVRGLELTKQYQQVGIPNFYNLVNNLKNKDVDVILRESSVIKAAATRFVDDQIMTPNPTNRPLWMSNPLWAFAAQLKSFMFVFGNTVGMKILRGVIGNNVRPTERINTIFRATLGLTLIMGVASYTDLLKEMIKSAGSDEPVKNFNQLKARQKQYGTDGMIDAIARTNIAGGASSLKIALDAHKYGSSPLVSILGGPVGTTLDKYLIGIGKAAEGKPKSFYRALVNTLPFLNVNREIKNDIVDILMGEKEDIESYEDFRKKTGLNKYFEGYDKIIKENKKSINKSIGIV